jgi:hypothetical protein
MPSAQANNRSFESVVEQSCRLRMLKDHILIAQGIIDSDPLRAVGLGRLTLQSAVESVTEDAVHEDLPALSKEDLPLEWQGEHPVLCVAGRGPIDEAAAIMLAQLSTAHGLAALVEGAAALSTTNVFRLNTTGARSSA